VGRRANASDSVASNVVICCDPVAAHPQDVEVERPKGGAARPARPARRSRLAVRASRAQPPLAQTLVAERRRHQRRDRVAALVRVRVGGIVIP